MILFFTEHHFSFPRFPRFAQSWASRPEILEPGFIYLHRRLVHDHTALS